MAASSVDTVRTHRVEVRVYSHEYRGGLARNVITDEKLDASQPDPGGPYTAYTTIANPFPLHLRNHILSLTYVNPEDGITLTGQVLHVATVRGIRWVPVDTTAYVDVVYSVPAEPPGRRGNDEQRSGSLEARHMGPNAPHPTISSETTRTHRVEVRVYSHEYRGGLARNVITDEKLDASQPDPGGPYTAYTTIVNPFPLHLRNHILSLTYVNPEDGITLTGQVLHVATVRGIRWVPVDTTAYVDVVYSVPAEPPESNPEDDTACKICYDKPCDCVLLECGHICTCIDCGRKLQQCPFCRQRVERVKKVYQI